MRHVLFLMSHGMIRDTTYEIVPLLDLLTSMIFSRVNVVVDEPSTYQQGSSIPEWQLAMSEKLAALDRTSTWDLFFYCHMHRVVIWKMYQWSSNLTFCVT